MAAEDLVLVGDDLVGDRDRGECCESVHRCRRSRVESEMCSEGCRSSVVRNANEMRERLVVFLLCQGGEGIVGDCPGAERPLFIRRRSA